VSIYDTTGRIFDIQRFSVHDGPGIRTIVFLKGCLLRCRWCCNPESQEWDIQKMILNGEEKIMGRDVTVESVMQEVLCDESFYRRSGGGLTLSGGEAMCQADFAIALLRASHENGINTAMETAASVPTDVVARIVPHVDYMLMDIKHMDSEKHKLFTGKGNELILQNARYIAEKANDMTVRVPVIPGFNDTKEEIAAIASFANSLPNVRKLHLLPYHRLGKNKYDGLGRTYYYADVPTITDEKMNYLLDVASQSGLLCQIGG
jgi:pyruvate formate lyase activating enzyme